MALNELWFDSGKLSERARIIAILLQNGLICDGKETCFACEEWSSYNGNEYSFCGRVLKQINEPTDG